MIRHIVLIKNGQRAMPILKELAYFCGQFEGVTAFRWGENMSIEPDVRHGFDLAFEIDFHSKADRDRYVEDSEHQKIGARLARIFHEGPP